MSTETNVEKKESWWRRFINKMNGITLLDKGLFEKKFMDSKARTRTVSKKEKILGHLIGPLGLIFVVNTIAAVVEKFLTQQAGIMYADDALRAAVGTQYELVMTITKFIGVAIGLLNSWLISHTKSRQGRMRPWYLIFGFISIIVGCTIFIGAGPSAINWAGNGKAYWIYFFTLIAIYQTIGSLYFYLFRDNIVSLTSRDPKEKEQLTFIRKMSWTLISGILIGMLVSSVVMPFWLEKDIMGYPTLIIICCIVAIPLLLIEYFYTRERVTEDVMYEAKGGNANKVPLKEQMKALFKNKFWVILTVLSTIQLLIDNFKGGNVQYFYIKFMLDGNHNGMMYMIYQIICGVPMGIGLFAIYPLARKIGIKNMTIGGYALVLIGSILGWIFPGNGAGTTIPQMIPAFIGGFLRNVGWLPNAYIFSTLVCYAFDDVEFRTHLRLEGLMAVGIVTACQQLLCAPLAGGYESTILNLGFHDTVDPSTVVKEIKDGKEVIVNAGYSYIPSKKCTDFMTLSFYLLDIIQSVIVLILLPFVNVEKKMPMIKEELIRRKKDAVLADGGVWLEPEEEDRINAEKAAVEAEQNRIADLHDRCEKKGLDFETENNKYLQAKAIKDKAWQQKQEIKKAKADAKTLKQKEKLEAKQLTSSNSQSVETTTSNVEEKQESTTNQVSEERNSSEVEDKTQQ